MTDLVWFHDMEFTMMQLFEFKIAQLAKMLQSKTPQELRCSSCRGEMEDDVDGREESKDTKPGKVTGINFIRFRSLSLAAHRHSSRVRADSSGW